MAQSIRGWDQVLSEWHDHKATVEVWNRVKFDGSEFSAVSGAEEVLLDCIKQTDSVQSDNWLSISSDLHALPLRTNCDIRFLPVHSYVRPTLINIQVGVANDNTHRAYDLCYDSPRDLYGFVTGSMQALIKTFTRQTTAQL